MFVFSATVQVPLPAHAPPLHPRKTDPAAAVALNVIDVPLLYVATHVAPQFSPVGELVTVPDPPPDLTTVMVFCGAGENVAVVFTADVPTVIEHVPVPEQAPVHPAKIDDGEEGVAVSVTAVPVFRVALHVPGQLMPPTLLVTDPDPVPATVTLTG